ncbi:MAG: hypothetical protein O3A00_17480 [Planctomycetota bacterium]|nr:hypothetical protein [Planctomycetota bacterium]
MPDLKPTNAKQVWKLQFEGAWPTSVAFLGPRRVVAGNRDGEMFVWDLPDQSSVKPAEDKAASKTKSAAKGKQDEGENIAPVRRLDGHTNGISRLVSTEDGKLLVSASQDHTVRIWESAAPPSGKADVVLDRASREKETKQLPQDKRQAFIDAPGVSVATQDAAAVLKGHDDWVNALGISRNGQRLISGDARSKVVVWDLPARKEVANWVGHAWNGIVAAGLAPDGQTALVSEFTYKRDDFDIPAPALKVWNVADATEKLDILKVHIPKLDAKASTYGAASVWRSFIKGGLIATDYSPDGTLVAVGQGGETDTGKVHLFDVKTGKLVRTVSGHQYGVCDVKFSVDGKYVLSSGRDTVLRICQVSDGKEVAALGKARGGQFKDWLSGIAISPDQSMIAAADIAGYVHVWQLQG